MKKNNSLKITSHIPITIGIIGHIDAVITDEHRLAIKNIFANLVEKYPHSPLVLFSQLAPGADTVGAEVFLEFKKESGKDCRLVVPIPFALEAYKTRQFGDDKKSLEHFENLLSQAERHFPLSEDNAEDKEKRHRFYREGGEFVADASMILIALFDNVENGKTGGTADTIQYAKTGAYKDSISERIFHTKRNIIVLECNREQTNPTKEIILKSNYLDELLDSDETIKVTLEKVDALNATQKDNSPVDFDDYIGKARRLPADKSSAMQEKYRRTMRGLSFLGAGILISFEAYKSFDFSAHWLGVFITFLLISSALLFWAKRKKYHMEYVENRALAEVLRIQMFWNKRNIAVNPARNIVSIYKKEYQWVSVVGDALYAYTLKSISQNMPLEDILRDWVKEQRNYFNRKIIEINKKAKQVKYMFLFFLVVGVLLLGMIPFLKGDLWEWLLIINTFIFGVAFLTREYWQQTGYQELLGQYHAMSRIYTIAAQELKKVAVQELKDTDKEKEQKENAQNDILIALGKEALAENSRWYLLYQNRELKLRGLA